MSFSPLDLSQSLAHVVDDDAAVGDSLAALLRSHSIDTRIYSSAETFLQQYRPDVGGCLLLDLKMPNMDGLELQAELTAVGSLLPIIFMSAYADVPTAVRALKSGAFDFLQKPFNPDSLVEKVRCALRYDAKARATLREQIAIRERLDKLTRRESEVLNLLTEGRPNKLIAGELNLSQRTVEIYRANVMQKMQVSSLAQLVKLVTESSDIQNLLSK